MKHEEKQKKLLEAYRKGEEAYHRDGYEKAMNEYQKGSAEYEEFENAINDQLSLDLYGC